MATTSIMWFRKGLRLHDNPALLEAIRGVDHCYPIFILDPWFLTPERVGANRLQFLLDSLADLDAGLRARGSRLLVLRGSPAEVLPRALSDWSATKLCFEHDTEPYALARDAAAREAAAAAGAEVFAPVSHTLYDPAALIARAGGKPPLTMTSFQKIVASLGDPPPPAADPPAALPPPAPGAPRCGAGDSAVPSLASIGGYPAEGATTPFRGGETAALARMADHLADAAWVAAFEKPKTSPAAFSPRPSTTVLSPYLKFGCLSPRLLHAKLAEAVRGRACTQPPVSLRGQLLWREFFYCVSSATPNFGRMEGNPVCRQIPWTADDAALVDAWEHSRTGNPWIDAIMAQLRAEGWVHHLARHSAACFLTRGDLWCSWERGAEVFERHLLDADWALNAGNWMWLSASAFFSQYFRVYSPVAFGKQYDKNGDYIRRYLPALKDFPAKYIYEPWTAPLAVQQAAGCVVGRDYPAPIVDHAVAMKANMERMKAAYAAGREAAGAGAGAGAGPAAAPPAAKRPRAS